jgi:hypothetical protein
MVLNNTFNNTSAISWWSILLVEKTRVPRENHRTAASHWHCTENNNKHSSLHTLKYIKINVCQMITTINICIHFKNILIHIIYSLLTKWKHSILQDYVRIVQTNFFLRILTNILIYIKTTCFVRSSIVLFTTHIIIIIPANSVVELMECMFLDWTTINTALSIH